MYVIIDLETTGLPKSRNSNYKNLDNYSNSRIISIAWQVLDEKLNPENKYYFLIKPSNFRINKNSIRIHGINNEIANSNGFDINYVMDVFQTSISDCQVIVAHNIQFDWSILMSELYRSRNCNLRKKIKSMSSYCTMKKGKTFMDIKKFPKLVELYNFCYKTTIDNPHNAFCDTDACKDCFVFMKNSELLGLSENG